LGRPGIEGAFRNLDPLQVTSENASNAPSVQAGNPDASGLPGGRRALVVASGAHALHDGYTDLLYILLPVWRAEFGLGFAEVGLLRALYAGAMAGFQYPAGIISARIGGRNLLCIGTALAGLAFIVAGASGGVVTLGLALVLGGIGSSVQHPIASSLVAQAFEGPRSRAALGTYNFAGDIGKMTLPAATAGLLLLMPWRPAVVMIGFVGILSTFAILGLLPQRPPIPKQPKREDLRLAGNAAAGGAAPRGFWLLWSIGLIDSATRMGFLTFLPFLLAAKGAGLATVGIALTLVFAGGAAGKLVCGFLGQRFGVLWTVCLTEGLTAAGILLLLVLPLEGCLASLPLIGVALNGTSSVIYGTVPELVAPERRERAFSIFYTGTIGGGALSPVFYGLFSDALGLNPMMMLIAGLVLATLPLAWMLNPLLRRSAAP
jgi:MFS family permease